MTDSAFSHPGSFEVALICLQKGLLVARKSWEKGVVLRISNYIEHSMGAEDPCPYVLSDEDLFANDWGMVIKEQRIPLSEPILPEPGSFSWALSQIKNGLTVEADVSRSVMRYCKGSFVMDGKEQPCLKVIFPNGKSEVWRPNMRDLSKKYSIFI